MEKSHQKYSKKNRTTKKLLLFNQFLDFEQKIIKRQRKVFLNITIKNKINNPNLFANGF